MDDQAWHKSSYSGGVRQNCVEVAESPAEVKVRDTQNRERGHLSFPPTEWSAFLADIQSGGL
ncbi:DUF397 domain-containing protein [Allosalinactinospora lopnorensis]|uniref:DUF397 domain-containing protein n=1 Tax=Allosalinactinospora lopnorensis TaxID=1352348 RepID=UPI0009E3C2B5|nr:DUF397 domain-containing protein [Allosalinactinospora lopnorensis]